MRSFIALAFAAALAACGPQTQTTAGEGCNRSMSREVEWSQAGQKDTITATSEGATCRQAVVTLVVRNAAGDPLWVMGSTYETMVNGGPSVPPAEVTPEQIDGFLNNWINPTENRTGALPPWIEGASSPGTDEGLSYHTDFGQEAYEHLRSLDLPQLCFAKHVESSECLVIDPPTGQALPMVVFGA